MSTKFEKYGTFPDNEKWLVAIKRESEIYRKSDDIRNEFSRDFNRILHCKAYRRLKHKTQVFYGTKNAHVCTRIEHVQHVAAISSSIAQELGLNIDLASAIALGHDIGHGPFGHEGEKILSTLSVKFGNPEFWHEQNSLNVADKIETLTAFDGKRRNLNLTYAVRDGLISHCGEVDENGLKPRNEEIDLYEITQPNQYAPFTWEACVVKIADKIAYLGRDIEDALRLNILSHEQIKELHDTLKVNFDINIKKINTTNLIHAFVSNLITHSSPSNGIAFSEDYFNLMNAIKQYNYKHIYKHKRLLYYSEYAKLILESVFNVLYESYDDIPELNNLARFYPQLTINFRKWLIRYTNIDEQEKSRQEYEIPVVYDITRKEEYVLAVLVYISLMSDYFALEQYEKLVTF